MITLSVAAFGKSFQDMVEFSKKVEVIKSKDR